jgi:CDP-diacylglycerol---serine O-phosphatidyltransferase
MKWRRIVPTVITLGILLLGFQSILKSMAGEFVLAAQFIVLAAILDGLDGEVARLFRGVTAFGAKLDTYVDTICFGVAPAVLAYGILWNEADFLGTLLSSAIVISGVIRFSRQSYPQQASVKSHSFRGLPIPVCAVWIALYAILAESSLLENSHFELDRGPLALMMWACAFAFLVLQVSNVRYAKPPRELIGFGLVANLVLTVIIGRPLLVFCCSPCAAILFFAFLGPLLIPVPDEQAEEEGDEEPVSTFRRWFR